MSMFKNVNVVYHYVKNWDAAKKFYKDLLGWPVPYENDEVGWCEFGVDGATHVAINRVSAGDPGTPGVGSTITFTVDSAEATQAWLQSKGVKCDELLVNPGVGKLGTFFDPEGNRMHFADSAPPPAA